MNQPNSEPTEPKLVSVKGDGAEAVWTITKEGHGHIFRLGGPGTER